MNTSKGVIILIGLGIVVLAIALLLLGLQATNPSIVVSPTATPYLPPQAVATFTPVVAPTATKTPWVKNTPTFTPQVTPTHTPIPTATPIVYALNVNANIRTGPGTDFSLTDNRERGSIVAPVARTADGQWIQIGSGEWVYAPLVDGNIGIIPITYELPERSTPTPIPTPTLTPQPTSIPQPTPAEYFHPFCLTDEFRLYTEQVLDIANGKELLLQQFLDQTEVQQIQESIRTLQQFEYVYADALSLSAPAELLDAHYYFMQSMLWFTTAGSAFELAYEWGQPHWIETAIERLKKSDEFASLADKTVGDLCFG